ncbi:hypothetical protein JCM3765_000850 [Sporobolomyces pararoseus]
MTRSGTSIQTRRSKKIQDPFPLSSSSSSSSFLFTNPSQTPRPPTLEQTVVDQTPSPPPMIEEEDLSDYYTDLNDHLLKSYTEANYSDFVLHVNFGGESNTSSFALHSLIVSQSPFLKSFSMLEKLEEDLLQSPEEEEEEESLKEILLKRLKNLSIEFKAFNDFNITVPTTTTSSTHTHEQVSRGGQEDLVQVFKFLPFEWFKNVLESQDFKVPSEMDRFNFAKKCVKIRKQYFYSQQQQSPPPQPQQTCDSSSPSSPSFSTISSSSPATTSFSSTSIDNQFPEVARGQNGLDKPPSSSFSSFEETVVLGFDNSGSGSGGGQNQSLVKILRKPIRRKVSFWKIGPSS